MFPLRSRSAWLIAATIPGLSRPMAVTAKSATRLRYAALSRQQVIERERRWALPAAIAAFGAAILAFVSLPIQKGAFDGTGPAEQLRSINEHGSSVVLASLLTALGLLLMIGPFLYLFMAAKVRSPAVRGAFVGFIFLGPILFAAQYIGSGFATKSLAEDFVAKQGELTAAAPTLKEFQQDSKSDPKSFDQITFYPDENGLDATLTDDTVYSLDYPPSQEKSLEDAVEEAGISNEEDTDGRPGDDLAQQLSDDSSGRQIVADLLLPALLGLITAVVYTCLHSMRVGLLTRFMGTLGMALGVSVVLVALFPLLLFTAALGLLFLGFLPGGRPPAWEAGEAIPWPAPGQRGPGPRSADADAEPIEGEATELDDDSADANAARRERAKKRKRKRRR
jgi:hypothetical protein